MATAGDRYWELVREQLTEERARKASIEQRGVWVITSAGTMVTLLFGLTALATKAQDYKLPDPAGLFLSLATALLVAAAFAAVATNWAVYYTEVEVEGLRGIQDEDWAGDEADAAKVVANAWTDIIEDARENNTNKGTLLRAAMLLEGGGLVAVTIAAFVVLGVV
jgi:hypothetical protein